MLTVLTVLLGVATCAAVIASISVTAHNDWLSRQLVARRLEQIRGN